MNQKIEPYVGWFLGLAGADNEYIMVGILLLGLIGGALWLVNQWST